MAGTKLSMSTCPWTRPSLLPVIPYDSNASVSAEVARFLLDLRGAPARGALRPVPIRRRAPLQLKETILEVNKRNDPDRDIPSNLRWLLVRSRVTVEYEAISVGAPGAPLLAAISTRAA